MAPACSRKCEQRTNSNVERMRNFRSKIKCATDSRRTGVVTEIAEHHNKVLEQENDTI